MKPKIVYIVVTVILLFFTGLIVGTYFIVKKINEHKMEVQIANKNEKDSVDKITYISRMIENNRFEDVLKELESKEENDSAYYSPDKKYLKITELKQVVEEKQTEIKKEKERIKKEELAKDKEKEKLRKKYKFVESKGWLHEKESKLMSMGFRQYKSGFEEAGDGSSQIATYYKKFENGITVHVRLQYSYSFEHHYARFWFED